jgi:hypothetical protein
MPIPMPESPDRTRRRLEPALAWTVLTDAPLQGIALAREAGRLFAWDEGDQLYLLDAQGQRWSSSRAPDRILAGAISDSGTLIALLGKGPRLWLLSGDLEVVSDRAAVAEASALAIDPHGRYVAVASRTGTVQLYTRHGRQAGRFEGRQPLAHLTFVPDRALLVGTSAYGTILAAELMPGGSDGRLDAEVLWQASLMANVGRLATSGSGGMVLASCFTHGVQRYDLRGHNEGAYHLGGSAAHAVPDFAGRVIAVSTLEGELAVLNGAGNVRWKTALPRPAVGLECDALGRYLIYGMATGEISRLDLEGGGRASSSAPVVVEAAGGPRAGSVRTADWTLPVAETDLQAETGVLTILDDPPRVGFLTGKNRLQVFTPAGQGIGQGPELPGVGRLLRTAPGWIAAATDRNVALFDARRNTMHRLDVSLVELTHLAIRPETFGVAMVQERDRVGRAAASGRWIWKRELKSPVEDLAIGPEGAAAVSCDDGRLLIFDPTGELGGSFASDPAEPLAMIEAPRGSPEPVAWLTLARGFQALRGHDLHGRIVWEVALPWEPWQLHHLGALALVSAPDGRAMAFDGSGAPRGQSRVAEPRGLFFAGPDGAPRVVVPQGMHLICSTLDGQVLWRVVADGPIGPIAAGRAGVAALIGRSLAWFGDLPTPGAR